MPTLEEVLQNALEIKDLPLRNALESTDCFEICTSTGASYRINLSQLGEGVTPTQPFSQAISGIDGNIVINHNLNKIPNTAVINDNNDEIVSLVIKVIDLNSVLISWNGQFSGDIHIN